MAPFGEPNTVESHQDNSEQVTREQIKEKRQLLTQLLERLEEGEGSFDRERNQQLIPEIYQHLDELKAQLESLESQTK